MDLIFEQCDVMRRRVARLNGGYLISTEVWRCGRWQLFAEKAILDREIHAILSLRGDMPICMAIGKGQ